VDKTAIAEIGPAGDDFSPADPVTITVKNTGRKATGTIAVKVIHTYDWVDGFWLDSDIYDDPKLGLLPSIQPGEEKSFELKFLSQDMGPLLIQGKLTLSGGNADIAAEIPVAYGRFAVDPLDIVTDPERLVMPASGEGSGTVSVSEGTEGRLWVSSKPEVAAVTPDTGALTLRKAGYTYLGYFPEDYESMNPADSFTYTLKGKKVQVHPAPGAHIVSAKIDGSTAESAKQIKVTFEAPITAESSAGFSVLNDIVGPITLAEEVTFEGTTLTLTMQRLLAWEEIQAEAIQLNYASVSGNVIDGQNNPTPDGLVSIALSGFTAGVYGPPAVVSAEIDANKDGTGANEAQAKKLYLTFNKPVKVTNFNGFTITGSRTAVQFTAIAGSDTSTLVLTLNDHADEGERSNVKVSYNASLGNVRDAGNEASLVSSFNNQAVDFKNYDNIHNTDTIPPKIVSAVIEDAAPSIVRVTFSEPVTVDASKFTTKVNNTAWISISGNTPPPGGTVLDVGIVTRQLSSSVSASADNSVWNLTLDASTKFGEIIRLSTEAAAATDLAGNTLPEIPQFIVRSLVKRVKEGYESQAGFYRNGVRDESVPVDGTTYQTSLTKLGTNAATHADHPRASEVITIVLDRDQALTAGPPWNSYAHVTGLQSNQFGGAMVIITTVTGNTQDFTITLESDNNSLFYVRNNITLVIDEHIIVTRTVTSSNNAPLVHNMDGGKLILDGGILQNNTASSANGGGGVTMGGGNFGSILLINSGKITGNQFTSTTFGNESAAGGVNLNQYGIVVMHGGEISNNTLTQSGGSPGGTSGPRAGGIAERNDSNQNHSNGSFYMTGGEIRGNKTVGAYAVASAGGVIVNGTFQKVGGTIYGSDHGNVNYRNTTEFTASVKAGAAAVINKAATSNPNPGAALTSPDRPEAVVRDTTTGPNDTLFLDSRKAAHGQAGINLVPDWAESFWDSP
jgi:hypothetical protein